MVLSFCWMIDDIQCRPSVTSKLTHVVKFNFFVWIETMLSGDISSQKINSTNSRIVKSEKDHRIKRYCRYRMKKQSRKPYNSCFRGNRRRPIRNVVWLVLMAVSSFSSALIVPSSNSFASLSRTEMKLAAQSESSIDKEELKQQLQEYLKKRDEANADELAKLYVMTVLTFSKLYCTPILMFFCLSETEKRAKS